MKKFLDRARLWGKLGLGMLHTINAFQVFVMSVLMFVAQLDPLPPNYLAVEAQACRSMFPGPTGWMSASFLRGMRVAHFPKELPHLEVFTTASRARVATHEDARHGGLRVRSRAHELRRAINESGNIFQRACSVDWLRHSVRISHSR